MEETLLINDVFINLYFVRTSSEGSWETAHMHRLVHAFASRYIRGMSVKFVDKSYLGLISA